MKNATFLFLFIWLFWSCSISDADEETSIIEVVEETPNVEVTPEEETEEEDRWANFVHSSMTIQPYYYPTSEIEYVTDINGTLEGNIVEGNRLVFYYYEAAGEKVDTITGERLADSGYLIEFLFAIDSDKTEFKLEKENFSAAFAKYKLKSNYPAQGYYNVTDGIIEGEKISDTEWKITANIIWTIPADEDHEDILHDFELSSNFIPAPQE